MCWCSDAKIAYMTMASLTVIYISVVPNCHHVVAPGSHKKSKLFGGCPSQRMHYSESTLVKSCWNMLHIWPHIWPHNQWCQSSFNFVNGWKWPVFIVKHVMSCVLLFSATQPRCYRLSGLMDGLCAAIMSLMECPKHTLSEQPLRCLSLICTFYITMVFLQLAHIVI